MVILVELEAILESEKLTTGQKEELLYAGLTRAKGHLVVMGSEGTLEAVAAAV